jgi:hypothetical protein
MNATLVYSSKNYTRKSIVSSEGSPVTKLFNSILREIYYDKTPRVKFVKNKYTYQPTDDYKHYVIRFKGII